MDKLKSVSRTLRRGREKANYQVTRATENFPLLERTVDSVSPAIKYETHFKTTDPKETAKLSINFGELEPCDIEQIDLYASATGDCPQFGPSGDGEGAYPPSRFTQVGGFILNYPAPGISVPFDGYYEIHAQNTPAGVSVDGGASETMEIVVNSGAVASQTYTVGYGINPPLAFVATPFNLYAVVYLAAGDTVTITLAHSGIEFWTPSDLCGLFGGHALTITLVGTP